MNNSDSCEAPTDFVICTIAFDLAGYKYGTKEWRAYYFLVECYREDKKISPMSISLILSRFARVQDPLFSGKDIHIALMNMLIGTDGSTKCDEMLDYDDNKDIIPSKNFGILLADPVD